MLDRKVLLGILIVVACSKSTRTDDENGDGRGGDGSGLKPSTGGNAGKPSTGGASAGTGLGGAAGAGAESGAAGDDSHGGESPGGDGPGGGDGTGGRPDAGRGGDGADAGRSRGGSGNIAGSGGAEAGRAGGGSAGVMAGAGGSGGGRSGAGGSSGSAAGAGGAAGRPTVILLIDSSSSMFETAPPTTWSIMQDALVAPTGGVLESFDADIDFGLTLFRGSSRTTTESDPACATLLGLTPMTNAAEGIGTFYRDAGDDWTPGTKWETPTGHAVDRVAAALVALPANPRGKFIVLITDGNPNTCATLDPQCGQDRSVRAVQDARAAGIRTLVVGAGDIVASPNNGCPASARCGQAHLQDLANAGVNQPVVAPSANYQFEACVSPAGLQATYSAVGGNAVYYAPTTVSAAQTAFSAAFGSIVAGAVP